MSNIEWTDKTWNPVTGCTKISPGCANCYAERMAKRLAGRCGYDADYPFDVTTHPDKINEPLKWKKPSKVFVCSMGDLFHKTVPFEVIQRIWATMAEARRHTFQILSKRPERVLKYLEWLKDCCSNGKFTVEFSLPNVWLGVSAENQEQADKRIPLLLQIPATVRFVSCEPLLGPIDLTNLHYERVTAINAVEGLQGFPEPHAGGPKLDWVIAGGESGPGSRPMHPDWVRSLRDQCQEAGVPFLFKQWGEWEPMFDQPWENPPLGCGEGRFRIVNHEGGHGFHGDGAMWTKRVGKKKSGRILDGREWDEYPKGVDIK